MIRLLRHLAVTTLIALALVPLGFFFPVLFIFPPQNTDARVAIFFFAPISCGVVVLFYSQLSSVHVWNRRGRLKEWREDHGGLIATCFRSTCWLFGSIFLSFAAEFAFIFTFSSARFRWLALATYSPLFFCWLWRRTGHV